MFSLVFSIKASTAVVTLFLPDVWTVSMFCLVILTKVSTAAKSHVFLQVVV